MRKKIYILGAEYDFSEDCKDEGADGVSEFYRKTIKVRPAEKMLEDGETEEAKRERWKEVVRHEIFHCFLYEAGNDRYAWDENLVNTLAVNAPKIFQKLKDLEAI